MKKRFSEEQIIGFLREAEAGLPVKEQQRCQGQLRTAALMRIWTRGTNEDHLRRVAAPGRVASACRGRRAGRGGARAKKGSGSFSRREMRAICRDAAASW